MNKFLVVICALVALASMALAQEVPAKVASTYSRFNIVLEKALPDDKPLSVEVIIQDGKVGRGSATEALYPVPAEVTKLKFDPPKLTGELSVKLTQPAVITLEAAIDDTKVTGKYRGSVAGKDVNGLITGSWQEIQSYLPPVEVPKTGIGFRGDGTGIFPDSEPPTEWDEKTGKNILWKTPRPNWGYGNPVAVGNRIYTMCEPLWGAVWPILVCYDAETGALLWQQEVDPFQAFPEVKAKERAAMTADVDWYNGLYRKAYNAIPAKDYAKDSPEIKKINEELAKEGMSVDYIRMSYGQLRYLHFDAPTAARMKAVNAKLGQYGVLVHNTWDAFGRDVPGRCHQTPVTDGKSIYISTIHGTIAAYDMDGNLQWCKNSGFKLWTNGYLIESPRLYNDLLLTTSNLDKGRKNPRSPCLIAWDKKTGEKRWVADLAGSSKVPGSEWGSRFGASITVMSVGKTDVALTGFGRVVRLPDGKVYDAPIGQSLGTWAVDDENDVIFSGGSSDGPSPRFGLKLSLVDDDLQVKVRYLLPASSNAHTESATFFNGRVFNSFAQLDPETGLVLGTKTAKIDSKGPHNSPQSKQFIFIANGYAYGLAEKKEGKLVTAGVMEVFTVAGKKVATNILNAAPRDDRKTEQWKVQGWPDSTFAFGCPFTISGDRIYVASDDLLYCIGTK